MQPTNLTHHTDDDLRDFEANGAEPLPTASQQGRIDYEGARIWYATFGAGTPVVLLHGAFDNSEDWGYQLGALIDSGHRVILIDNRGRGRSTLGTQPLTYDLMASEVLAVLDALGIPKVAVVGWSDGASIGLILAIRNPSRVTRVFAFAGSMSLSGVKPVSLSNPLIARVFGRAMKDYERLAADPTELEPMRRAVSAMMATEIAYTDRDLAAIRTPVAIVVGENDEFIKPEHSEHLAHTIPQATLTVLPGVSHFAMLQRPDVFNDAMLAFLRATDAPPASPPASH